MLGKKSLIICMIFSLVFSLFPAAFAGASTGLPDPVTITDPRSMAYHNGYIYVAQRGQGKISRISTTTGQVSDVLNMGGSPMAVAMNSQGDLFYTRDSSKTVSKIPAASLTNLPLDAAAVTSKSQPFFTGNFNYIYGLTFDSNDNLYMVDNVTKGIYKLAQGQSISEPIITGLVSSIYGIGFSPNGDLYFIDDSYKVNRISQADLTGKTAQDPTKYHQLETVNGNGIVFLPDGTHYISSLSSGKVFKHEFAGAAIAAAKALIPSTFTAVEGTHTSLLNYLNGLPGMAETGVALTLQSSNANVATNGTISYTDTAVTGNVIVQISKAPGTTSTKIISVTVPAHTPTPEELANASISAAKALIPSTFTAAEGTHTNLLTYLNGLPGMGDMGVTLTLLSSNANIDSDGTIHYTDTAVSGNVTVQISKAPGTMSTKIISVTVPAHTPTPEELANAAISAAKALIPATFSAAEGTHTNLLTYLNGLPGMGDTGVTLTLLSSNANIDSDGTIHYTDTAVSGNVTVQISKAPGVTETKVVSITVPAHIPTLEELANASISAAKAIVPSSVTVTEGTYTNLLTYLNGLPGMADTGVTLTLVSAHPGVANNGTITYSRIPVSGDVTVQINKAGGSQAVKTITVQTLAFVPVVPNVGSVAYSTTPTSITLNWINPSIAMNGIKIVDGKGVATGTVTASTYTFTGLTPSTEYTYKIIVLDDWNAESSGVTVRITTADVSVPVTITGLSVSPITTSLVVGGTASTVVTATYSNHTSAVVTHLLSWVSDNEAVASVSSNGVITAHSAGSATITGTLEGHSVSIVVAVTSKPQPVSVTSLSINTTRATVYYGEIKQLAVTATYSNGATADVTATAQYGSSDENIATVSPSGLIKATGYGTADITITIDGVSQTVSIYVPGRRDRDTGSSAPTTPVETEKPVDTNQPSDTNKPSDTQNPAAQSDVFNNKAVQADGNVVNNIQSRIEAAQNAGAPTSFADTQQHWAQQTIDTFIRLNLIEGYADGTFKPNGNITRAEFAAIIARVFPIGSGQKQSVVLNDIGNHWAKEVIEKLANAGIVNGYGEEFRPDNTITRAEMVAIISRIVNMDALKKDQAAGAFSDIDATFAADSIRDAAKAGIVTGKGENRFDPEAPSTRAESLTIILNALNLNAQIKTLLDSLK